VGAWRAPIWSIFDKSEQNEEWAVQRARYMTLETSAPLSDDALVSLPATPA